MSTPGPAQLWKPRRFVDAATRTSLAGFLAAYGTRLFLLVDVRHAPASLVSGLDAICELGSVPPAANDDEVLSTLVADEAELGAVSTNSGYEGVRRTAAQIARRVARQERFVVPIAKRVENAVANKVTVGRTANNDVMLKHGSISKFHASFEVRDKDLFVRDAESKNGTMINGEPCKLPVQIQSGDIIVFGGVETMVCNAEALWQVLNERIAA